MKFSEILAVRLNVRANKKKKPKSTGGGFSSKPSGGGFSGKKYKPNFVLKNEKKLGKGGASNKSAEISKKKPTVIVKNNKIQWSKKDMDKRDAVIKQRKKDAKKPPPANKAEHVLNKHREMQDKEISKHGNKARRISVEEAKKAVKADLKKFSSKARKPNSKTRKKASDKINNTNVFDFAKEIGMSQKHAEAAANAAMRSDNPLNNEKAKGFLTKAFSFALKSAITVAVGGAAVAASVAMIQALPPAVLLIGAAGILKFAQGLFSTAEFSESQNNHMPMLSNFIPMLASYVKEGNLEEVMTMIEQDTGDEKERDNVVYSIQQALARLKAFNAKQEVNALSLPSSVVFRNVRTFNGVNLNLPTAGFYMCFSMKQSSAIKLAQWAVRSGIPNPDPATELHCTIVYSKMPPVPEKASQKFFMARGYIYPAMKAKIKKLQLLGPKAIVLILDFPEAEERNAYMMARGCTSDYPSYTCHTTVGKNSEDGSLTSNRELKKIELPTFDLEFDYEYSAPLLDDRAGPSISESMVLAKMLDMAGDYNIMVNNGFRYEYDCTIQAKSPQEARKIFLNREKGSWKASNPKDIKAIKVVANTITAEAKERKPRQYFVWVKNRRAFTQEVITETSRDNALAKFAFTKGYKTIQCDAQLVKKNKITAAIKLKKDKITRGADYKIAARDGTWKEWHYYTDKGKWIKDWGSNPYGKEAGKIKFFTIKEARIILPELKKKKPSFLGHIKIMDRYGEVPKELLNTAGVTQCPKSAHALITTALKNEIETFSRYTGNIPYKPSRLEELYDLINKIEGYNEYIKDNDFKFSKKDSLEHKYIKNILKYNDDLIADLEILFNKIKNKTTDTTDKIDVNEIIVRGNLILSAIAKYETLSINKITTGFKKDRLEEAAEKITPEFYNKKIAEIKADIKKYLAKMKEAEEPQVSAQLKKVIDYHKMLLDKYVRGKNVCEKAKGISRR